MNCLLPPETVCSLSAFERFVHQDLQIGFEYALPVHCYYKTLSVYCAEPGTKKVNFSLELNPAVSRSAGTIVFCSTEKKVRGELVDYLRLFFRTKTRFLYFKPKEN